VGNEPAARPASRATGSGERTLTQPSLLALGLIANRTPHVRFGRLDAAEEKHQVTDSNSFGYYAVHTPAVFPVGGPPEVVTDETVPFGEVDIRRDDTVRASDGEIGHVEGLVIERVSRHVTHVLLQEGHLWGRKQVAIPIETITKVGDSVEVSLSKQQVHALPSIEIEQPNKNG
jgi:sporulation protein YlmC with PRC-barrel domain